MLEAFGLISYTSHDGPNLYRLDITQFHAAQRLHDVVVIAGTVHFDGGSPQILFVGGQPNFSPLAHEGMISHRKARLIFRPQRLFGGGQLGQGAAVHDFLPAV